jgi:nitroimidazol reductase NimA-like FMN-containing flavoprotein (pyridoxamine 5'-phosphate oxidase superfamily)
VSGDQGGASVPDIHMEELDDSECRRLLAERHLGRLAIPDFGGPVIFPVNYVFDQDLVVFRTDPGSKLDAATEREQVAFEVDATDEATRTGWSVVVRGTLAEITDPADLARLRALPLYPWAPGEKTRYVRVRPGSITGRRIRIPDDLPSTWWG